MNTHRFAPILTLAVAALTGLVLSGCVDAPPPRHVYREARHRLLRRIRTCMPIRSRGRSPEQQDRDRYDCHLWAVKQSGFDPSAPAFPRMSAYA